MSGIEKTIESENFSAGFTAGQSEGIKEAALECIKIIETRKDLWGDKCDTAKEECKVLIYDIKNHFGV